MSDNHWSSCPNIEFGRWVQISDNSKSSAVLCLEIPARLVPEPPLIHDPNAIKCCFIGEFTLIYQINANAIVRRSRWKSNSNHLPQTHNLQQMISILSNDTKNKREVFNWDFFVLSIFSRCCCILRKHHLNRSICWATTTSQQKPISILIIIQEIILSFPFLQLHYIPLICSILHSSYHTDISLWL